MIVTATEFKSNLGKYLDMVATQDVYITKNGKKHRPPDQPLQQ